MRAEQFQHLFHDLLEREHGGVDDRRTFWHCQRGCIPTGVEGVSSHQVVDDCIWVVAHLTCPPGSPDLWLSVEVYLDFGIGKDHRSDVATFHNGSSSVLVYPLSLTLDEEMSYLGIGGHPRNCRRDPFTSDLFGDILTIEVHATVFLVQYGTGDGSGNLGCRLEV